MGQVEMGGGSTAVARQRHAGRSPGPVSDLAGGRRSRSADRKSQLHLEPALLSRLPGSVGEHLYRPRRSPPLGAMRFVASFVGGGLFDRFPTLRMGVLEGGF